MSAPQLKTCEESLALLQMVLDTSPFNEVLAVSFDRLEDVATVRQILVPHGLAS